MSFITVIIPCYNAAAFVRETLASVVAQEQVELQVIVIDDGSTDDSAAIVAREFPSVELIHSAQHGASRARNVGLAHARGAYIQFLDADDMLCENKLARQRKHLEYTNADVVYGDWQLLAREGNDKYMLKQIVANEMRDAPELELLRGFYATICAYLFRREIVERAGGFREDLPIIQDARFVLDCALRGARFAYLPGVAGAYRIHAQQLSRNRVAFVRDCLTNVDQVQLWWRAHGGITPERHAALVQTYGNVARMSYEIERATFWSAYRALLQLEPHYAPASPRALKIISRAIGYPRAEAVASEYRQIKRAALGVVGHPPSEPYYSDTTV